MGLGQGALEAVELSGRSILVTGAYGLLGSWLVKALLERGARVAVVRYERTARSALQSMGLESDVGVVEGDIRTPGLVAGALEEHDVDSVFHLAAQPIVPLANKSPVPTFETNIAGTWTVLEACRQHGSERVIVASSDKAYGPHATLPYREDFALQARYPYDVSKAATDLLARSYWHSFGLPVAVTRLANIYGGGDPNPSRLVPEAITAALGGRRPVLRSDGSPERDFLYVEDAVAAYLAVWAALENGGASGEAFNAGGGRPHRVSEVVDLVCRLAGTDLEPEIRGHGTPSGEIDRQWVDHSKLTELTGWQPSVSLEQGLARAIEWYRSRPAWVS